MPKFYDAIIEAQMEVASKADKSGAKTGLFLLDSVTGVPYYAHSDGTFRPFGASPAGQVNWRLTTDSPPEAVSDGLDLLDFTADSAQEIWASFVVPADYVAGTQISLIGGKFATDSTYGNVMFKATAYLIKAGELLSTRTSTYKSSNAKVAISGAAGLVRSIGTLDLTSSSGKVKNALNNDVSVAAGDILLVKLAREIQSEGQSSPDAARLIRYSMVPKFTA